MQYRVPVWTAPSSDPRCRHVTLPATLSAPFRIQHNVFATEHAPNGLGERLPLGDARAKCGYPAVGQTIVAPAWSLPCAPTAFGQARRSARRERLVATFPVATHQPAPLVRVQEGIDSSFVEAEYPAAPRPQPLT